MLECLNWPFNELSLHVEVCMVNSATETDDGVYDVPLSYGGVDDHQGEMWFFTATNFKWNNAFYLLEFDQ